MPKIEDRGADQRRMRTTSTEFHAREENGELWISGYFSVFNSIYELWPGATESVAPGAFRNTLGGDIRALTNHDTTLVLGRTTAGTLKLREDEHGLWGDILINPKDSDAVNTRERVLRGDVNQCSFGFRILDEEVQIREDDSVHWTIKEVELYEVSVCTFPAYEETSVQARGRELADMKARSLAAFQERMKGVLDKWH